MTYETPTIGDIGHPFRCPLCGDRSEIDITALVDVRITDDGSDATLANDQTHFWEGHSPAQCGACGHTGEVYEFKYTASESEGA